MLVAPLNANGANPQLRLGRIHQIGELPDSEMRDRIPFKAGDRIAWIDAPNAVHVLNETLLLVPLGAPLAYEPAEDLVAEKS